MVAGLAGSAHAEMKAVNPAPQANTLNAVWSIGKVVWAVGDGGAILRSDDDGDSFRVIDQGTRVRLLAVWGSSADDVYITGDYNVVLHTSNGGKSWSASNPPTGYTTGLYGVWGSGPRDVYVVGVNGAAARSTDRGKTWTVTKPTGGYATIYDVWGSGPDDVHVCGERGLTAFTRDGGKTWQGGHAPGSTSWVDLAGFARGSYFVVGESAADRVDGDQGVQLELPGQNWLEAVWSDGKVVVMAGQNAVLRSSDRGKTLAAVTMPPGGRLMGLGGSAGALFAVGERGLILRSRDAGATWAVQSRDAASGALSALAASGKTLVVVGESGAVARSVDGGATWVAAAAPRAALTGVVAVDGGFVACGKYNGCMRSADGATWSALAAAPKGGGGQGLAAVGGKTLVWVGDKGLILRSIDGGATWSKVKSGVQAELRAVWSGKNGVWVAGAGVLLRSTDGGASFTSVTTGSSDELHAVWSDGDKLVIAVGTEARRPSRARGSEPPSSAVVVRSTDAGKTWNVGKLGYPLMTAYAVAGQGKTVWLAGSLGELRRSTDAGATWQAVKTPSQRDLRAIWLDASGQAVVAGDDSVILRGK